MKKYRKRYKGYGVTFLCLGYIILALLAEIAMLITYQYIGEGNYALLIALFAFPASAAVAMAGTIFISQRSARGTNKISHAVNEVAKGDFSVRIEEGNEGALFNEVYRNFNKMVAELSSVETLREDYVSNFSHEMKTPISAINGYARLLESGSLSKEESMELLSIIVRETENLSRLSQNILLLSKVENQQVIGKSELYRLDLQIKDCIIMLAGQWEEKGITINSELQSVEYTGDEQLIKQIWINLLSNAIKFTPSGGEVTVTLTKRGDKAVAVVADNGVGISETDIARVFDKYYQAGEKSGAGSGLGLAICKRICEIAGGNISVESRLGEGSAFTVEL